MYDMRIYSFVMQRNSNIVLNVCVCVREIEKYSLNPQRKQLIAVCGSTNDIHYLQALTTRTRAQFRDVYWDSFDIGHSPRALSLFLSLPLSIYYIDFYLFKIISGNDAMATHVAESARIWHRELKMMKN